MASRIHALTLALTCLAAPAAAEQGRPTMRALPSASNLQSPPTQRDLVEARVEMRRRFREPLAHTETATGARVAADVLIEAAAGESDRSLRWLLLVEARRLAVAAGSAAIVDRAVTLASANYAFDAEREALRSLSEIPLRGLHGGGATELAEAAERVAMRAETDRRLDLAVEAQSLAIRAWQRAGNRAAARLAAARHDAIELARVRRRP